MSIKEELLKALDCALEDISEERLVGILIDAYQAKKTRIADLEGANAADREMWNREMELTRAERYRMHADPLYRMDGDYYFKHNSQAFIVRILGGGINMFVRVNNVDCWARQLSPKEWKALNG